MRLCRVVRRLVLSLILLTLPVHPAVCLCFVLQLALLHSAAQSSAAARSSAAPPSIHPRCPTQTTISDQHHRLLQRPRRPQTTARQPPHPRPRGASAKQTQPQQPPRTATKTSDHLDLPPLAMVLRRMEVHPLQPLPLLLPLPLPLPPPRPPVRQLQRRRSIVPAPLVSPSAPRSTTPTSFLPRR